MATPISDLALQALWAAARERWPGVDVAEADFGAYVRAREAGREQPLDAARAAELYLACACAARSEAGLAAFEAEYFPEIDAAARRVGGDAPTGDELRQVLRHRLFVAEPDALPKIVEYTGRGALRIWVRITATRTALNLAIKGAREVAFDADVMAYLIGPGEDPELAYMKRVYTSAFKDAFAAAFGALDARERNLLRYAFGKGLTVDAIGTVYGVHRATAARWVSQAHARLAERTREHLAAFVGKKDLTSLLCLIDSKLQITLDRYLKGPTE